MDGNQPHIAFLPSPGVGHLIPLAELARRLLLLHPSLSYTFLLIPSSDDSSSSSSAQLSSALPAASFDAITLPPPSFPPFSDLLEESNTRIFRSVNHSLPSIRQTLRQITRRHRHVSALVLDIFSTDAIHVASDLGIKPYLFFTSSAIALSFYLHFPELHETTPSDEWRPDTLLKLPGCPVVRVKDTSKSAITRDSIYYTWFLEHARRYKLAKGILLNSFEPLEGGATRALVAPTRGNDKPQVYAVGPIVRTGTSFELQAGCKDPVGCLTWLDGQPGGSVLYVSFGSGGTLSTEQVRELAWGLEMSHQRFVWVVRAPNDLYSLGTYLSLGEEDDPLGFLPEGFVDRTQGRGLVVKSWAPQERVLGHEAVGGFLTHCGWNSVLEGVVNGVGFIAWPLYAEQGLNAVELVEEVKVALKVDKDGDGTARRDVIARVVKQLMEGEEGKEIKARMKILKAEATRAFSKQGSSNLTLSNLAQLIWN